MAQPISKKATYEDILKLPENVRGEILGGELHVSPRPSFIHQKAMAEMMMHIGGRFRGHRGAPTGWIIVTEPELHLNEEIIIPDLAGWRAHRATEELYSQVQVSIAPDWVCEIQSPSTARVDRVAKRRIYLDLEIPYYWLLDPRERTLEALKYVGAGWMELGVYEENAKIRVEPFEELELDLGLLWA